MKLRLNEFKALYNALKTKMEWVNHLLLSFLHWLEEKLIDNRVKVEVNEAIKEYKTLHEEPMSDMVTPVYTEEPSKASTSLPEMRLTAPWYIDSQKELKGR